MNYPTWPLKGGGVLSIESEENEELGVVYYLTATLPDKEPFDVAAVGLDSEENEFSAVVDDAVVLCADDFVALGEAMRWLNDNAEKPA